MKETPENRLSYKDAQNEAQKIRDIITTGEATNYDEAERIGEKGAIERHLNEGNFSVVLDILQEGSPVAREIIRNDPDIRDLARKKLLERLRTDKTSTYAIPPTIEKIIKAGLLSGEDLKTEEFINAGKTAVINGLSDHRIHAVRKFIETFDITQEFLEEQEVQKTIRKGLIDLSFLGLHHLHRAYDTTDTLLDFAETLPLDKILQDQEVREALREKLGQLVTLQGGVAVFSSFIKSFGVNDAEIAQILQSLLDKAMRAESVTMGDRIIISAASVKDEILERLHIIPENALRLLEDNFPLLSYKQNLNLPDADIYSKYAELKRKGDDEEVIKFVKEVTERTRKYNDPNVLYEDLKIARGGIIETVSELPPQVRIEVPEKLCRAVEALDNVDEFQKAHYIYRLKLIFGLATLFGLKQPEITMPKENDEKDTRNLPSNIISELHNLVANDETLCGGFLNMDTLQRYSENIQKQLDKLDAVGERRPAKILEVGAGSSYTVEHGGHYSVPRYSRAIKNRFAAERISVQVTDIRGDSVDKGFVLLRVDHNGRLHSVDADQIKKGARLPSKSSGLYGDKEGAYRFMPLHPDVVRELLYDTKPLSSVTGRYYARPVVDPIFEKIVFDTDMRGEVDMLKLEETYPEERFDYVFGVHLEPSIQDMNYKKISNMLEPGGKLSLDIADFGKYEYTNTKPGEGA